MKKKTTMIVSRIATSFQVINSQVIVRSMTVNLSARQLASAGGNIVSLGLAVADSANFTMEKMNFL